MLNLVQSAAMNQQLKACRRLWTHKRPLLRQVLRVGMTVASALVLWNLLKCVTCSKSPVVVVLTGSMEPALQRGDILFLNNCAMNHQAINVGDIVVFSVQGRDIPIVHRIVKKAVVPKLDSTDTTPAMFDTDHDWRFLTKGDANLVDDVGLYASGQDGITRQDMQGTVVGVLRHVGFVTILLNDFPIVKYVLLGMMGLMAFTSGGGE